MSQIAPLEEPLRHPLRRLEGKIALVTGCGVRGAGWGNGKAIAVLLARQGAVVFGVDLDREAAEATCTVIGAEGGLAHAHVADVTDAAQVKDMVEACMARFGRIDILINNVGRSEPGGPAELTEQTWDEQMDVNVKSAFLTCRSILPIMERQGAGAVVNISSVAGLRYVGKPQVAYAAGKAALMQLTRTTAVLYAGRGIRLNCVVPGLMHTPLVQRLAEKYANGDVDAFVERRHRQVPMGRMGDAWDVAHAVLFLASDESRYVTAQEIVVDGGLTAATGP
ncbi:SDR family NAD(P)-dependent oxidoreductase [Massilia sp. LXY-6]|uniref:SDR family NAD(P)-dependent oxidoreductase n=1 Tax=Massilia sp. LXY-6 TaxID=3379823 RepID=UPI003EE04897